MTQILVISLASCQLYSAVSSYVSNDDTRFALCHTHMFPSKQLQALARSIIQQAQIEKLYPKKVIEKSYVYKIQSHLANVCFMTPIQ